MLAQERFPLRGVETTATLSESLAVMGADLLAGVLAALDAGVPVPQAAQRTGEATYCRLLLKEDGVVDWAEPASLIERKVRAYDPWPRAVTTFAGETLLLLQTHVYPDTLGGEATRGTPGEVLAADGRHGLLVHTGHGILAVERLQKQFKKPLDWRSFLNGHPGFVGSCLGRRAEVI